jgi:hypothetical protein
LDHWAVADSPLGIVVTARGCDKARTFGPAISTFHELIGKRDGSFAVIGDLRETTGYETEARVAWQKAFYRHRNRVKRLVLVGETTPLVRMGVAVLGAFTGIPVRFVSAWGEVAVAIRGG